MLRSLPLIFICVLSWGMKATSQTDTFRVYFDRNVPALDDEARMVLDSLLYNDLIHSSKNLLIIGYADYLGSNDYNDKLSASRANNVKNYLVQMHIPATHIKLCVGTGEIERNSVQEDGYPADRKVEIVTSNRKRPATTPKEENPEIVMGKDRPKTEQAAVTSTIKKIAAEEPSTLPDVNTLQAGQTFVMQHIYFYPGRHFVREESLPEMENLYRILAANETIRVRIEGHICCVKTAPDALDEDTYDLKLSANRAKYIYDYLAKRGIARERMEYIGFGRTRPLVEELYPGDENKNRRVEIRILQK